MSSQATEGVFAIHKPSAISSAQVIRDAQAHFNPSKFFSPWIRSEEERQERESHNQKQKRRNWKKRRAVQVKMGHGGTLDPMATGVLILGVGSGTKSLSKFLECTKSYETVLLFGKATDTYDTEGKVVARKAFDHITRETVEAAMEQFRGQIMQRPPIFSALRVQGKRLYEYAREGKEVPVEIKERPVEVKELELLEWMEGGTHPWHWPEREANKEEKVVVDSVLHLGGEGTPEPTDVETESQSAGVKRRREDETINGAVEPEGPPSPKRNKSEAESEAEPVVSGALQGEDAPGNSTVEVKERPSCAAPACRIRMTVTSGFYVRSLCHDLGAAVGSLGCMASLVRTRQGDFELGKNVLEYEELDKGEDVWAPRVEAMLADWRGEKVDVPKDENTADMPINETEQAAADGNDTQHDGRTDA